MTTNLMDGLRVHNAKNLIESFNYPSNEPRAYIFIGKTTPWDNDREPPVPQNDVEEQIEAHNQMLSCIRINKDDAFPMIRRKTWTQNIVYDYYSQDISVETPAYSGAVSLKESNYYVINSQRDVFVCLDNNQGSLSVDEPLNRTGDPFLTADGYQWMLLYSLNTVLNTSYTTDNFIPVVDTFDPRQAGEINTIIIKDNGTDYTDLPEGVASRVRAYYCPVDGDGTGAVAKVHVDGTTISKVEVVRKGQLYAHAQLNFVQGNVYKSLYDLDNNQSALNPEGNGDFRTKVIISPVSGWRFNLPLQLVATDVGVFSQLKFDTPDFVTDIEFRQVGILQDPIITITDDLATLSALFGVKVIDSSDGNFNLGEEIVQINPKGEARGTIVYWNKDEEVILYYQDYEEHNVDGVITTFQNSERIIGTDSGKIVNPDTSFTGEINSHEYINGFGYPEFIKNSGVITYLSNLRPVRRNEKKSEKLSIIINF